MDVEYIKMCKEAYPFLTGFIKEESFDAVWCNGYQIFSQPFGSGTNYTDFDLLIEPPMKNIEKFRIFNQDELQKIALKMYGSKYCISNILHFLDMYIGDINVDSGGIGIDKEIVPYLQELSKIINYNLDIAWLCFVMEKCFKRKWSFKKEEWELII